MFPLNAMAQQSSKRHEKPLTTSIPDWTTRTCFFGVTGRECRVRGWFWQKCRLQWHADISSHTICYLIVLRIKRGGKKKWKGMKGRNEDVLLGQDFKMHTTESSDLSQEVRKRSAIEELTNHGGILERSGLLVWMLRPSAWSARAWEQSAWSIVRQVPFEPWPKYDFSDALARRHDMTSSRTTSRWGKVTKR